LNGDRRTWLTGHLQGPPYRESMQNHLAHHVRWPSDLTSQSDSAEVRCL